MAEEAADTGEQLGATPRFLHPTPDHKWPKARRDMVEPYRGALDMECSLYYWWWLYAQLTAFWRNHPENNRRQMWRFINDWKLPCTISIEDFYSPERIQQVFMSWWKYSSTELFAEPTERTVRQLETGSVVPDAKQDTSVAIPVEMAANVIWPQVKCIIEGHNSFKTQGEGRIRSAAISVSAARYKIEKTTTLPALYRYAEAFLLMQHLRGIAPGQFQMGHLLACARENPDATPLPQTAADLARFKQADVSSWSKEASRRYSSALRLIDGVRQGRFPYYARVLKTAPTQPSHGLGFMVIGGERYRPHLSVHSLARSLVRFKPLPHRAEE